MPQRNEQIVNSGDAGHVEALAAHAVGEPAGDGQDDGARDEIAGEDPGGLFLAGAEGTGDVGKGDVGDGGVEDLHEGGESDGKRDGPRIVAGLPDGWRECIRSSLPYQSPDIVSGD